MKKKEIWTFDGRKKIFLVDDNNQVVEELEDLGPLSPNEKRELALKLNKIYEKALSELETDQEQPESNKKEKKPKDIDE
jgi:hypothetical protein